MEYSVKINRKHQAVPLRRKPKQPSPKSVSKRDCQVKRRTWQQTRNKNRLTKERFSYSQDINFSTVKTQSPFKGYWHWGCYGTAEQCMGCALSAPVYGQRPPPKARSNTVPDVRRLGLQKV